MAKRLASTLERFVGRANELRKVDAACGAASDGRGSVAVVSGEAGIGKTRFCEEVARRARDAGLTVVVARCWVDGGALPLWPWQPILAELGGHAVLDGLGGGHEEPDPSASSEPTAPEHSDHRPPGDRFERFSAVTDQLAAACARSPLCLVVDDVHAADAGTLLLIRFVVRSLASLPLALVLSRRDAMPAPGPEAQLLDEIEGQAVRIALGPFDRRETSTFLSASGHRDVDPELLAALHRMTGGHPLFLRRLVALGTLGLADTLPGALHVAIDQALTRLSPDAQRLLRTSAVLGSRPRLVDAAVLCETEVASVVDAVGQAVDTGLVALEGSERFAFSHDLVRATLEEALSGAERLDAHARAGVIVARDAGVTATAIADGSRSAVSSEHLARRAHHALAAAPRSAVDARLAVAACEAAAEAMVRDLAYEQADDLLSAAVEQYESSNIGPTPAGLLVRWAEAASRCGRMADARARFDHAACVARSVGDAVLFAEAALGLGGHGVNEHRLVVERARVLGLQRSALAELPEHQATLRRRLEIRLLAEAVAGGDPIEPVYEAVDQARRGGDLTALAEALALCHAVLLTPEHTWRRMQVADELIRVAAEAGDGVLGLMGQWCRTVDLFHLGDPAARASLEYLRVRASVLESQNILANLAVLDVMLLIRAGRLKDAEVEAQRCFALGEAVGEVNQVAYLGAQTLGIRWIEGQQSDLLDLAALADDVDASPAVVDANFAFRASAVAFVARGGDLARARVGLGQLTRGGLAALRQSSTWLVGMTAVVDAAAALDDPVVARAAYELLLPYADLPVIGGAAVLCLGSAERPLGAAAAAFDDLDQAIAHLERAVHANDRLEHRPMVALSRADLAAALARRDREGDRAQAVDLFEQAVADADGLGLAVRADAWRQELAELRTRRTGRDEILRGSNGTRHGVIGRCHDRWVIALDGRRVRITDRVGMRHLTHLLTHPGEPMSALHLAARAGQGTGASPDDASDAKAGSAGVAGEAPERARTAVRKAIKRAVDAVADADPSIADVLRSTVTTGTTCVYTPDPNDPVAWSPPPVDGEDPDLDGATVH
ncbi:MAG: ATP-binding protein [Acidimicrobiales bacterium]